MPVQDFLITFRADTTGALTNINALAQRVADVDAALNTAMGRLQRSATNSPLNNIASGAAPAARSINDINRGFLQMGHNVKLSREQVDALLLRVQQIQRNLSRDTRGGFGPQVNMGQIKEAARIWTQLRDAGKLTADEWKRNIDELNQAFGKLATIPEGLRNLPIAQQSRIRDLMRRELSQGASLDATRQPLGGERNLRSHQAALESYIRTVRELGQYGLSTAADLDKLEAELRQVRAASSLQTQRRGNDRTVQSLRDREATIRGRQPAVFGSSPQKELTDMRALERTLIDLQNRGQPVQRSLDETRTKIQQLEAAAALASQRLKELNSTAALQAKARDQTQRLQGRFSNVQQELAATRALENTLFKLEQRGEPVTRELARVRAEVDRLAASALRAKSLEQLLRRRDRLSTRAQSLSDRGIDPTQDRGLVRAQLNNERALASLGNPAAAANVRNLQSQFAALPPVIDASTRRLLEFTRALQNRVTMGETLRLPPQSPAALTKGLDAGIELMKRGYAEGAQAVDFFGQRVAALPPTLDRVAQGMLNHGRRVAEGLFIYEALGRAMQAVGSQIELVNDLAREQIRFSAVAGGLPPGGSSDFLLGLQDIAVRTNTPMAELAAQIDTVGAAMIDNGDAAVRMADSQQFLNDVGQFTNITQRDLASETENLLGIYQMADRDVGAFTDRLGRITVAGRNSSAIIAGITDVLSEAGRSARATGFDFDFLASIGGQLTQELIGTMSGSEIGGMLNTIIGRLTDPEVINKIRELSDGMISFSNADGSLRDTHSILIDIFQSIEDGTISAAAAPRILDQIVPPLNPAARAFVSALQRNIPEAVADMGRIMAGGADDAKALSDALVSGPGERFAAAMKDVQGALTGIFSQEIIAAGNQFADILRFLAGVLGSGEEGGGFGGALASVITRLALFSAAWIGVSFAIRNVTAIITASSARMTAIQTAINGMTVAANANTTATTMNGGAMRALAAQQAAVATSAPAAAGGILSISGAMTGLRTIMGGVLTMAKGLYPILLTMFAMEIPDSWNDANAANALQEAASARSRIDPNLLSRGLQVASNPASVRGIAEAASNTGDDLARILGGDETISDNQFNNVVALSEALIKLERQGKLTAQTQAALERQILTAGGAIKETAFTSDELLASLDPLLATTNAGTAAWNGYTEGAEDVPPILDEITAAEKRATEAMAINTELSDARAEAMRRLTDQLRDGSITLQEWADGQDNATQASEAAANFVAAYGDQLSLIPGLQERIARTGETAAEALMGMLLDNPDTISERIEILDSMVAIAEANEEAAASLAENPLELSVETEQLIRGQMETEAVFEWLTTGTYQVRQVLSDNPIEPEIALTKLKAQAAAVLKIYQVMLEASAAYHRTTSSAMQAANPEVGSALRARANQTGSNLDALQRAIAELEAAGASLGDAGDELRAGGEAFDVIGGIDANDPRLDSTSERQPSQTGIIDIGELPPSAIQQIIAIATAAQKKVIAAGGEVDTDETAAIFKDAAFQTLIKGIDQRFLQQAIEELTDVEKRRLELEQQRLQDVTRSLVSRVGPIQSLISSPVVAAGGGVLSGQGVNADPTLGNFTINVPINWSGMNLSDLQKLITQTITQAFVDAQRGG